MHTTDVVERPADLTAEWLTAAVGIPVSDFAFERIGTGQMSECYRVALSYADGNDGPSSVVLKVAATVFGEAQALAQLQHTNIVPIYSVHRAGVLQAVCMPYLGSATLADVLKYLQTQERMPRRELTLRRGSRPRSFSCARSWQMHWTTRAPPPGPPRKKENLVLSRSRSGLRA